MKRNLSESRRRALRLYFTAQAAIVVGAAAMTWLHSCLPMALAGSAALMLTIPLVKDIARARRVRR